MIAFNGATRDMEHSRRKRVVSMALDTRKAHATLT